MMRRTELKIERAIEEILALGKSPAEALLCAKKNRGRPKSRAYIPVWDIGNTGAALGRTIALISMCIKEDPGQSLEELASRLAEYKLRPFPECLSVLQEIRTKGTLGYYETNSLKFKQWEPGKEKEHDSNATD